MRDWLCHELAPYRRLIAEAYLFGSVLDPTRKPRDIDLAVVTADRAGGTAWQQVRMVRDTLISPFLEKFGIPLSIIVLTISEWRELDGTIIRERETLW